MRLRTVSALVGMLALSLTADALAQPGGGRGGRGGFGLSRMGLLGAEKVQEELKVTDEQQEKVETARDELREARGGGGQTFRELSGEELVAAIARRRAERTKAEKEKLATILDEAQLKRLNEIYVQAAGADALLDADVAAALKITDEQKEKLQATQGEMFAKMREAFQGGGGEGGRERMAQIRKETDEAAMAVLTDEQKEQLGELKGEPIELTQEELSDARGFGGGRRGGGNQQ